MLPHPVLHPEVAPTALATLGKVGGKRSRCDRRARRRSSAALVGDPGETIAVPDPPDGARDLVLAASGFAGTPPAPTAPATNVIVLDVAGLYDDELFADDVTATAAAGFRALAATGTRFEDCWTESRDWPVTEYQMLAGGYPVAPFVAAAEDDPTDDLPAGPGPPGHAAAREPRRQSGRLRRLARAGRLRRRQPVRRGRGARPDDGVHRHRRLSPAARQSAGDDRRRRRARRARRPARRAGGGEPGRPPGGGGARRRADRRPPQQPGPERARRRWPPPRRTPRRACRARW